MTTLLTTAQAAAVVQISPATLRGWASLQMVDRYMHLAPSHLASFANNI